MATRDPRAYWTEVMEAAYGYLRRVYAVPVAECREGLVDLRDSAAAAGVRVSFSTRLKPTGHRRFFYVRESLAPRLLRAAEALLRQDLVLHIEDGWRSLATQTSGVASDWVLRQVWERTVWETGTVPGPDLLIRRLSVYAASAPAFANHTFGSAVDAGMQTLSGDPVDLGGTYPEFTLTTPMDSPFVSPPCRRARCALRDAMEAEGLLAYPFEFWHYSWGDADHCALSGHDGPARYGPMAVDTVPEEASPECVDLRRSFVDVARVRQFVDRMASRAIGDN